VRMPITPLALSRRVVRQPITRNTANCVAASGNSASMREPSIWLALRRSNPPWRAHSHGHGSADVPHAGVRRRDSRSSEHLRARAVEHAPYEINFLQPALDRPQRMAGDSSHGQRGVKPMTAGIGVERSARCGRARACHQGRRFRFRSVSPRRQASSQWVCNTVCSLPESIVPLVKSSAEAELRRLSFYTLSLRRRSPLSEGLSTLNTQVKTSPGRSGMNPCCRQASGPRARFESREVTSPKEACGHWLCDDAIARSRFGSTRPLCIASSSTPVSSSPDADLRGLVREISRFSQARILLFYR